MANQSGWVGYGIASLYPDMGNGVTQTMATTVDPEEQEALSGAQPESFAQTPVSNKSKQGIWMALGALGVMAIIFGLPGGAK